MAKPTSTTFGDGIPVEDVAAATLAPPERHSRPGAPFMANPGAMKASGNGDGEHRAHQRTFGTTAFEEPYEANRNSPKDFRISPPETGYGIIKNGTGRPNNAGTKGAEAKNSAGVVTFGDTAADAPMVAKNVTAQNRPPGGVN